MIDETKNGRQEISYETEGNLRSRARIEKSESTKTNEKVKRKINEEVKRQINK